MKITRYSRTRNHGEKTLVEKNHPTKTGRVDDADVEEDGDVAIIASTIGAALWYDYCVYLSAKEVLSCLVNLPIDKLASATAELSRSDEDKNHRISETLKAMIDGVCETRKVNVDDPSSTEA